MTDYAAFIQAKSQIGGASGFEPLWMPDFLFDFQKHLVDWAIRKGKAAIYAECGLGKTPMQLVWAENVVRKTNKPVLVLTPLAVAQQTAKEGLKFGIDAQVSVDGSRKSRITITNYEKLHHFSPDDYVGLVCDESSILKSYHGAIRKRITRFISKMPYRLLCTATAAPNDWVELGTSSEALGELSNSEMLKRFFRQLDDKGQKKESKLQEDAERLVAHDPQYFGKLAFRIAQTIGQWRLKNHAVTHFWRWVASWSRACRMPSDLGFDNGDFDLPPLKEVDHIIKPASPPDGMLFTVPAFGMGAERDERRRTLHDRCRYAADLVDHDRPAIIWCHMNSEGDLLEKLIPGSVQLAGRHSDRFKEAAIAWFCGDICRCQLNAGTIPSCSSEPCPICGSRREPHRVLITKPKIASFGLNFQHCNHVVSFATHSYEQYYQSVRRCYRFGQRFPVRLDLIATEGEVRVLSNMRRKADQARKMFEAMVREMSDATRVERENIYTKRIKVPSWLSHNSTSPITTRSTMGTVLR